MNDINNTSYINYLLNLIQDSANLYDLSNELKLNIYITLIALSNSKYSEEKYQKELSIAEDFLRKTNNLKVKIQLKRKEKEINDLLINIKKIYEDNTNIINKYNPDKLDIIPIIESKNPSEITKLIDKLTKEKIHNLDNKDMFDNLRNKIINNIFNNEYHIEDNNTLYLDLSNDSIVVSLDMFYQIFDYLLNIDNYPQPLLNTTSNRMHTILSANIIKVLIDKQITSNETIIPIILTNIINKQVDNQNNIDYSNFFIDNIKITDLYKLAENKNHEDISKSAKWRKVIIPNEYMHERIKDISKDGTYYFKDDIFYMEKIIDGTSDFKVSISKDNMLTFLKSYLESLTNKTTYTK